MRVVIGTGKALGFVDREGYWFNKFCLNPAVSYFDYILVRVYPDPKGGYGPIYAYISFHNPLLACPPGAKTGLC